MACGLVLWALVLHCDRELWRGWISLSSIRNTAWHEQRINDCLPLSVCVCVQTEGIKTVGGGNDPSLAGCIVSYGGHNGISWTPSRAWDRLTKLGEVCAFCEGTHTICDSVMSLSRVCIVHAVWKRLRWVYWLTVDIFASYLHSSYA